jgi:hypothetical protein
MRALRDFLLEPAPRPAPTAPHVPPAVPFAGDVARAPEPIAADAPPIHPLAVDAARAHPSFAGDAARAHPSVAGDALSAAALARPRAAALPPGVALLCPPAHARALGMAAALLLARRARARAGLVVVWAEPHVARPATAVGAGPAARRLASTLAGRGLEADAAGRLAVVVVPADPVQAAAAAARAIAAGGPAPSVLVLGRRDPAFDALLGDQDRVLVAASPGADGALHALAVAGLASVAAQIQACRVEPSPLARAIAAWGLWVPATVRRPLGEALRGLTP